MIFSVGGAPDELDAWESLARDFEARSNISVEVLRQPADTAQQRQGLVLSMKAGLPDPDVFLMDVAWIGLFAHSNWLEPLSGMDTASYFEEVLRGVDTHEGALVAVPVYMDAGLLYYRRDLLEEYRVPDAPATWDELRSISLRVQQDLSKENPSFFGFVWQGAQYEGLICTFLEFAGAGGGLLTPDSRVVLDTDRNRRALQFMHDLIWKFRISPPNTFTEMREEQVRRHFQRGDALFERNWPYAWNLHQNPDSPVKGKTGIAAVPGPLLGQSAPTLGGWHIGISRFSDSKEAAQKFVDYVTSYEGQKKMVLLTGWNPGRRDLYEDREILEKMPFLKSLEPVFLRARARPGLPYYSRVSDIVQRWVNAALAGRIRPELALGHAEREISALVARYVTQSREKE